MMPSQISQPCLAVTSQTIGVFAPDTTQPLPCQVFTPGSLKRCVYKNPPRGTVGVDANSVLTGIGTGTNAQIYTEISNIGAKYRVTAAHLEVHYIGNDDQNGGEFIVNKFKPTPVDNGANHTWNNTDKFPNTVAEVAPSTVYLPAKKGLEVLFFANERQQFQAFTHVNTENVPETSMEACIIWLQGAATGAESKQEWRWTLTQTIEIVFEPDSFFSKFHMTPPCGKDEWNALYDYTVREVQARGDDVTANGNQQRSLLDDASSALQVVSQQYPDAIPQLQALAGRAVQYGLQRAAIYAYRQMGRPGRGN